MTNVQFTDNFGYAISNKSGLVNMTNVVFNAATTPQAITAAFNEINNAANSVDKDGAVTGGIVISGTNKFNTKITNSGLIKTSGSNTFSADIANTGVIQMGGENTFQGTVDKSISIYNGRSGSASSGTLDILSNATLNLKKWLFLNE